MMTVGELIRLLQTYPQDMPVVVDGYEGGYDDLKKDLVVVRDIRLNASKLWWEGQHRDAEGIRGQGHTIVKALAFHRPKKSA